MPRDGSKNLKPQNMRTKAEQKKIAAMGGVASGEARREKRTLRKLLEIAMERPVGDQTTAEAITVALLEKAMGGDVKAFEVVRDTLGENPKITLDNKISGGLAIKWQD